MGRASGGWGWVRGEDGWEKDGGCEMVKVWGGGRVEEVGGGGETIITNINCPSGEVLLFGDYFGSRPHAQPLRRVPGPQGEGALVGMIILLFIFYL